MFELTARIFVYGLLAYAAAGVMFAGVFVTCLTDQVDSEAVGAGRGFRLLILPGVAAVWPLLLMRGLSLAGVPQKLQPACWFP